MDSTRKYYVYAYLRQRDSKNGPAGSPYYIGKGTGGRAYDKRRSAPKPTREQDIIVIASEMSEADALQAEVFLIYCHGRLDLGTGPLRNRTDGGEGTSGFKHSQEEVERRRLRKPTLGMKLTEEQKKKRSELSKGKIGLWMKGKTLSEEHKQAIRTGVRVAQAAGKKRGKWTDEERKIQSAARKGKPGPRLGQTLSAESRQQISDKLTGRTASEETKKKLRDAQRARREREKAAGFISEKVQALGQANRGRKKDPAVVEKSRPAWREAQQRRREKEREQRELAAA